MVIGDLNSNAMVGFLKTIPSGYVKIAIENGHRNSGFTHYSYGDFL